MEIASSCLKEFLPDKAIGFQQLIPLITTDDTTVTPYAQALVRAVLDPDIIRYVPLSLQELLRAACTAIIHLTEANEDLDYGQMLYKRRHHHHHHHHHHHDNDQDQVVQVPGMA